MRGRSIAAIWAGGIILAVLIYAVGPDRFVWGLQDFAENFTASIGILLARLGTMSFDLLRALAIALFAVFVGLSIVAVRRRVAGRLLILVVTGGFLALITGPAFDDYAGTYSRKGWVGAFVLSAIGALLMTRRLLHRAP